MGLISYRGLNRLVLGLRFRWAAAPPLRWGWDRYCHTSIISSPTESKGMQIIRPANPEIEIDSDDRIVVEDEEWLSYQRSMKWIEDMLDPPCYDEQFNVNYMLDEWVDCRGVVPARDLKKILSRLREEGRFSLALKVCEWMRNKGIYKFSSSDHGVMINLIWRVQGYSAVGSHVRNLPKQARNDRIYGMLLHCYVHEHRGDIRRSPSLHLQKMKELGFALSPRPFNEIMRVLVYQPKEVLKVLAELKKSKVSPNNDSYRICISSFGLDYDVDGMERMLREMESQPRIVMDWCTYAVVAEFYDREFLVHKATSALEKARVILQKKGIRRKRPNYLLETDYENVIKSLVKLGELDEAMKFVKEWEVLGNWCSVNDIRTPYPIIEEYIKTGTLGKALSMIYELGIKRKGVDKLLRLLSSEYLKVGDLFRAYVCFRGSDYLCERPLIERMFLQYLEEECGSLFPLCCGASLFPLSGETLLFFISAISSRT